MAVVTKTNVLTVGIKDRADALKELPVRVVTLQFGCEAASSFKYERYDGVVSRWHLADMADGQFLRGLRSIRPDMPTVAIVEAGNVQQEINARSLGVSAVLTDDCSDDQFVTTVSQILGLISTDEIEAIYAQTADYQGSQNKIQ